MVTDQIADLLTRIRNAHMAGHPRVRVPASRTKERILSVMCDEGYILSFESIKDADDKPAIEIVLRYDVRGKPAIKELKRMSSPGRRWYVGKDDIPNFKSGLGTVVVSTSKGMLSDKEARRQGVGGELVCSIF